MPNASAIEKVKGPCVILAGAGTGKTYTIVEKIKHLVENGIYSPEKIVCITFSNEAANNLLLRVQKAVNLQEGKEPIIKTFHAFSAELLRKHGENIGISKDFRILDPDQAKVILHRNLKILPMNCHRYIATIGTAKDLGVAIEDFQNYLERETLKYQGVNLEKRFENLNFELQTMHLRRDYYNKKGLVAEIKRMKRIIEMKKFVNAWRGYEKLKQKGNYQDYSDLNKNALLLLEKNPDIAGSFDYVIVDEFQDTNKLQLDFLIRLAREGNITIVGDLNQSIYRFRGAYKENLGLFKKAFSVSENDIFNLAKSYRSPNKVLRAAHKLILNNYQNKDECFFVENANNREGEKIKVFELKDAKEEARKVIELIKEEQEKGTQLEEICVMFRTHQYGRIIKRALEQESIVYYSVSKASLLKQKSVKTAKDYLVILYKLKSKEKGGEQEWWDLLYNLNFQQGDLIKIGKTIKEFSRNRREENEEAGKRAEDNNGKDVLSVYLFNNIDKLELSENGKVAAKVLTEKIKMMLPFLGKKVSELLQEIYRISGLIEEQKFLLDKEIMLNLNKFYELAKVHEELYDSGLDNFLYYLDILGTLEIEIDAVQLEEKGVRLMTSHSTKGLEYSAVIITNMAQGRFPLERYINNTLIPTELMPEIKDELKGLSDEEREQFVLNYEKLHQLMEERRLAYVSFTRAKEKLALTFAGDYAGKEVGPSLFLEEISFKNNSDTEFQQDFEQKYKEPEIAAQKSVQFSTALGYDNFAQLLEEMAQKPEKEDSKESRKLSPSALLLFENCQKEFEYKYVYNMPERKKVSWEAMRLGSFVHLVLEKGVKNSFARAEDFLQLARELSMDEEWESISLDEAETLIKVFFERHKGRYNEKSKTELYLPLTLGGINFIGFADRIDFSDNGIEIVDYKTGKTFVAPLDRNWQLGFYALAAQEKYGRVKKVILDMLKQERPLEFKIDEQGNAECISSKFIPGFNIYDVEKELIDGAKKIQEAYKSGFKPCAIEKNCDFCNEYIYGL